VRVEPSGELPCRPDDVRLGAIIERWAGDAAALRPGRAVLLGFPQDEGVRRNGGRVGAAEAPREVRRWLDRLGCWHPDSGADLQQGPPLDLGDIDVRGTLEASQEALAEVVALVLAAGAVPIVLGGGHETAFGHYLGYVRAGRAVSILNVDAHLDVRPLIDGEGHSGSPFRQAMEHPTAPLPGERYACLGVQPHAVSYDHWDYACRRGCAIHTADDYFDRDEPNDLLLHHLDFFHAKWSGRLAESPGPATAVYVTIDADVAQMSDVPGVSAPNVVGLPGRQVIALARRAGQLPGVTSLDLVEINPRYDRDGQSARWAALVVWSFLIGLRERLADDLLPSS
jgi:formiminoglutamase